MKKPSASSVGDNGGGKVANPADASDPLEEMQDRMKARKFKEIYSSRPEHAKELSGVMSRMQMTARVCSNG
eukprot:15067190-Alexandrium_andersonii.AAC.1